jgi:MacB-like periplasmic core domain
MNGFFQDLRVAMRGLRQKPAFALLAILILALGSGATTIMFTVISGVVLKPLAYPDPDKLITVHLQSEKLGDIWGFSYPDFLDCQRDYHSFEGVAAWGYSGGTISAPGEPEYVTGRLTSSELFSVLGIHLVRGRSFEPEEDKLGAAPVAIISTRLWQQRYGSDPRAVGMPLNYDGKAYTIVGIAPPGSDIVRLVLRESLVIILTGTSIGFAISLSTGRLLQHLVPVVQTSQASIFAVILPGMIVVALLASYIPARRAARVDPMLALRYE